MDHDIIVIGGGLVGAAVAYGLTRQGLDVALLDEGDTAFRASFGNFGLVWIQGKGEGLPAYAAWTRQSAGLWPGFAARLQEATGLDLAFHQPGGLIFCLGEEGLAERADFIHRMHNQMNPAGDDCRLLDRAETKELVPAIGPQVSGACYCAQDGQVNPLLLLRALLAAARQQGMRHLPGAPVTEIKAAGDGFALRRSDGSAITGRRLLLTAGLGNARLAEMLGRRFPVHPERGQILVTQRSGRFLEHPTATVRQTAEGTVLLGDSKEDAGFDLRTTSTITRDLAQRALAIFPRLSDLPVVRTWAALRVLSPDGFPIYQQWADLPNVFALACHSGVTLAAVHAERLAPAIAAGRLPDETAEFRVERFDVQSAA